jgi:hypothetical protein
MSTSRRLLFSLIISVSVFFVSCGDDPEPTKSETMGVLLAGKSGASKGWILTSLTSQNSASSITTYTFDACFLDNVFRFQHNELQRYEGTEGSKKCGQADLFEAGSWAFTENGKMLIISIDEFTVSDYVLFASLTYPAEVLQLDEDVLHLKMTASATANGASGYAIYNLKFTRFVE